MTSDGKKEQKHERKTRKLWSQFSIQADAFLYTDKIVLNQNIMETNSGCFRKGMTKFSLRISTLQQLRDLKI